MSTLKKSVVIFIVVLCCLVGLGRFHSVYKIYGNIYVSFVKVAGWEPIARYVDPLIAKILPISDKFWIHRANALKKLETVGQKYKGVEIDVHYYTEENAFDVSHDERSSIDYPLENTLAYLGHNQQKIWIDYKNLNVDNAELSCQKLEELLFRYGVAKERCIIESPDYHALKIFKEHGFYTSYFTHVLTENTERGEKIFMERLRQVAASGNVDAVSFPDSFYPRIKRSQVNLDLLVWNTHDDKWWGFYIRPDLNNIRKDDKVKVILVHEDSSFHRD